MHTRFTELFGLSYPVMSAPMTMHSGPRLAAAVSGAGGLGALPGLHPSGDPEWIRAEVASLRATTDRPFAIGFITAFVPFAPALFEAALAERPACIALSFGDPAPWIEQSRAAGVRVICQVQTSDQADAAVEAGADVLAVQGTEAGGHTGSLGLLPLLSRVAQRHPAVPLLAAGGIGDGVSFAAALVAGADGAWLGTAFLATPEAVEVDDAYKRYIVESDGSDTVYTHAYDIVSPFPWPDGVGERVRRNHFTDQWSGRDTELRDRRDEVAGAIAKSRESAPDSPETREVMYGHSAGAISAVRPAAEVVQSITDDAAEHLRRRTRILLGSD